MSSVTSAEFSQLPDPAHAGSLEELIAQLRLLKGWAGSPSYETITRRVNAAWAAARRPASERTAKNTVAACFRPGRRRPNDDLLIAIVEAIHPDPTYVQRWREALRIVRGEAEAATFVHAQPALPDDVAEFTGRSAELARLADLDRPLGIAVISGLAGIGKTQLAVHAAHELQRERPFDQVLFVNLNGFHDDPRRPPADPTAVLGNFLRLLGVAGQEIPHDRAGRERLYRERLRDKRALILLDNAAAVAQLLPLLPGGPPSLTLITSRDILSGLPGAMRIRLGTFSRAEALRYLRRSIGAGRIETDPTATAGIAAECGYLPLALHLVAARIRDDAFADWTLANHHARLVQRRRELKVEPGVAAALDLSRQALPAEHRRLFQLLALHPGGDFSAHAAAALADTDLATAQRQLDRLVADNLLEQPGPGRYQFHDLVHTYAAAQATDNEADTARQAATFRLAAHYLHTASIATDRLYPHERHRRPATPASSTPGPAIPNAGTARDWLDAERVNLLAVATQPTGHGPPGSTAALSATLNRYLLTGAHYADAELLHSHAVAATEPDVDSSGHAWALTNLGAVYWQTGRYQLASEHLHRAVAVFHKGRDPGGEAFALNSLGAVYGILGNYRLAADHFREAFVLFRELGDRDGQARALSNTGTAHERTGHYDRAAECHQQALDLFRALDNPDGTAWALSNLGIVDWRRGHYAVGADHHRQALDIFRHLGDRYGQARTLDNLGILHTDTGEYGPAADCHRQALAICRAEGDQTGEAGALTHLGVIEARTGRYDDALRHHRRAFEISHEIGDPAGQAEALNGLAEAVAAQGEPAPAMAHHRHAHRLAVECSDRVQKARAHDGLGRAHHRLGEFREAQKEWRAALALYEELGVPQAAKVRTQLQAEE